MRSLEASIFFPWRAALKPPRKEASLAYWKVKGLTEENQCPPANNQDQLPDTSEGIRDPPGQSALQLNVAKWVSPGESSRGSFPSTPRIWEIINIVVSSTSWTVNSERDNWNSNININLKKEVGDLQDGRGVRCRDHLPPHKYIRNTSTCGTTPTEHLLNTGRRPQTSQKARKWVGQKTKEKTETKE